MIPTAHSGAINSWLQTIVEAQNAKPSAASITYYIYTWDPEGNVFEASFPSRHHYTSESNVP